jgi:hypothetical protein
VNSPAAIALAACLAGAAAFAAEPAAAPGTEVQAHGLAFEHWVCDTFFDGFRPAGYTQHWDIPAAANRAHGGIPVNPKAVKFGSPVGLGDALRQFDAAAAGPFLLVVGFWEQIEPATKRWVNVQAVTVTPERWRGLWHPLTRADLAALDAVVKDPALTIEQARARVAEMKRRPPYSLAAITLNPKLDRSQRRLQCSLAFRTFFARLAPDADPARQPGGASLWGRPVPDLPGSGPRVFAR